MVLAVCSVGCCVGSFSKQRVGGTHAKHTKNSDNPPAAARRRLRGRARLRAAKRKNRANAWAKMRDGSQIDR